MKNVMNSIIRTYYDMMPEGQYLFMSYDYSACLDMKELQIILKRIAQIEMAVQWCIQAGRPVCVLDDNNLLDYIVQDGSVSRQDRKDNKELEWLLLDGRKAPVYCMTSQLKADYRHLKRCCLFMSAVNCRRTAMVGNRHAVEYTFLFYNDSSYILLDEIYGRYMAFLDMLEYEHDDAAQKTLLKGVVQDIQMILYNIRFIWNDRNGFLTEFRYRMLAYKKILEESVGQQAYIELQAMEEDMNRSRRNYWTEDNCFCMLNRHIGQKLNVVISHIQRFMHYYEMTDYDDLNMPGNLFGCGNLCFLDASLKQVLENKITGSTLQEYRRLMNTSIRN